MRKALLLATALTVCLSAGAQAEDLYEEYHGGLPSGLYRGFPVKPRGFGPQPQRSLDPLIRRGLGDFDHDGLFDRFDYDADNDGMLDRLDRDPYDSGAW
jgi:hypothetical protein